MKLTLPALGALLLFTVPAAAFPAAGSMKNVESGSGIVEAQYHPRTKPRYHQPRYHQPRAKYPRSHYRAGHRYRSAPHGWHRYHARPGNWQRRGCIVVGPAWFCP
jgi:hypothetical protein